MKMYNAQKAKGLFIKLKYQKLQASISKWDVLIQNDQMLWCAWSQMKSFKIMLSSYVGGHIYILYNWDWSLFLVLIMYVFVELIIEASH